MRHRSTSESICNAIRILRSVFLHVPLGCVLTVSDFASSDGLVEVLLSGYLRRRQQKFKIQDAIRLNLAKQRTRELGLVDCKGSSSAQAPSAGLNECGNDCVC